MAMEQSVVIGKGKIRSTLKRGIIYIPRDFFELEKYIFFCRILAFFVGYEYEVATPGQYITTKVQDEKYFNYKG
ncbi:hypothetical protein GCM10020331_002770 [Ectobacillus funiculus]